MRFIIVSLFFLFWLSPSSGQNGFNKKYDLDEPLAIFLNCTWVGGDTLALYGLAYSDEVNLHKQGLLFARADTNGNVIDYHIYNDSVLEYSTYITASIIKLNNNLGFALLAIRSGIDVLIIIDNYGEVKSVYEYPNMVPLGESLVYIIEANEYFYISGRQYNQINQGDLFIMKINKGGDIIWVKPYGTSNRDDSVDSFFKINENELIVGYHSRSPLNTNPILVKNSPKIFAIDSLGNVKWSWEGPFSKEENLVTGLHRSANNFWYYNTYHFEYRVAEQAYYWQPKFVKRDSNFNLVWSRPVGEFQSFFNGFNYSFPTQNGEWMAVGNTLSGPKTLSGWMYRMSTDGDSLWSRLDTAQASGAIACENYLYGAVELPGGSIIACGYSDRLDDVKPWGWLIKVDQNGCLDTLDCKLSGEAVVHNLGKPGPRVYPNPVSSVLYFDDAGGVGWDRIDLCNTLGQTVLTVHQPAGHQLDVSALPAGLYWVRFYAAGRSWVRPVVKM